MVLVSHGLRRGSDPNPLKRITRQAPYRHNHPHSLESYGSGEERPRGSVSTETSSIIKKTQKNNVTTRWLVLFIQGPPSALGLRMRKDQFC